MTDGSGVILLADPRVADVAVRDCGEPLVRLGAEFGPARSMVRAGLADRLLVAASRLPVGFALRVVEGYRSVEQQQWIIDAYSAEVARAHPLCTAQERMVLVSRFVSPVAVAPHVAGAAVDLTMVNRGAGGREIELDLGTPIDATPEASEGRCFTDSPQVSASARSLRGVLGDALRGAGLVNYPTEWWHWSFGDRYWALATGAPVACYGPVSSVDVPGRLGFSSRADG